MASTQPPNKKTTVSIQTGPGVKPNAQTTPGTVISLSGHPRAGSRNLHKYITKINGPRTLLGAEHTLAELPRITQLSGRNNNQELLDFGSGNRTVVSDGHGLLTEILMRDPIRSLFNQNVLNIHNDPAQLDKAFGVIQGLIVALADSTTSDETRAKIERESVNVLKILGVDVSVDFSLDNLDVVFKTDNLAKFFKNPQIADLYDGKKGKEELVYALAALLELNKANPDRSQDDLSIIKESLYSQINEKAVAKGIKINLDEDPKKILNTAYVNEILSLLTLKSTSDQIFKRHYASNENTQSAFSRIANSARPRTIFQRLSERFLPGKTETGLVADLCNAVYGARHDSNSVIALSDICRREDADKIAGQRFSDAFARLKLPNSQLEPGFILDSDELAAAVMNNLVVGNQLLASPKTVKYIFLASHIKRSGVLTKGERQDFAMSLISDLKERLSKRNVDTRFLDALRQRMGDGRFVHFLTNKICEQLMYQEIGMVAINDIQKRGLKSTGAVGEFKMDMDSPAGKNYSPKEQVVANMIIKALDTVLKTDQSLFRHTDIKQSPQFKQIEDAVRESVIEAGPNLNMSLKEGEALFESLIGPVYNDIRFYVVSTHNLATFLEHTFPYAQRSASDLSQDFLNRSRILQKLNLAVTIHANIAQRVSKDMPLDIFNYDDKQTNTKFELVVGDGMADLQVRNQILDEVISEYDGLQGLEKLSDRDMTPKPILFGDEESAADFGQILYKALRKRFKFTDTQLETFDNLYLADHGKERTLSRRRLIEISLGGTAAAGLLGVVGATVWILNSPKPFYEMKSYSFNDLEKAFRSGDLDIDDEGNMAPAQKALYKVVDKFFPKQVDLKPYGNFRPVDPNAPVKTNTVMKNDFVFLDLPFDELGQYPLFEGSGSGKRRDSREFPLDIKNALEDSVFKLYPGLSDKEKVDYAVKVRNRLFDLIDNYEGNRALEKLGRRPYVGTFHPVIVEAPDSTSKNKKFIPLVLTDMSHLKGTVSDTEKDNIRPEESISASIRSLQNNFDISYTSYKLDNDELVASFFFDINAKPQIKSMNPKIQLTERTYKHNYDADPLRALAREIESTILGK